jgi:DNA-binding NtrC family response regulator
VVYNIVTGYGGDIAVESAPGPGSVFTIHLPISSDAVDDEPANPTAVTRGSERILFVDDEQSIAKLQSKALGRLGYRVVSMTDSREALELFRKSPLAYDLIVTDMTMPHLTGDKLAAEIMALRPGIPIIVCTGFNRWISEESADRQGISAFLMKPYTLSNLSDAIRSALDRTRD